MLGVVSGNTGEVSRAKQGFGRLEEGAFLLGVVPAALRTAGEVSSAEARDTEPGSSWGGITWTGGPRSKKNLSEDLVIP